MELRFATPADDAELRRLAREIPMVGPLTYALEREPDFFAFARLQGDESHTMVIDAPGGGIVAMGSGIIAARRIGGRRHRVLYVSDLKVSPPHRKQGLAAQLRAAAVARLDEYGIELSYGLVLGGNRAIEAMIERTRPPFRMRKLGTMRSHSFFLGGAPGPAPEGASVRSATPADIEEMVALWRVVHAKRDLAPDFPDAQSLLARLGLPGGMRLEDFLLVHRGGRLTAFAAVWDPVGARQVRVLSARGALAAMRFLYNPLAALLRRPRMPADGQLLRSLYLSYLCAEAPADLRALLLRAKEEHRRSGHLLLEAALDLRDPLTPALESGVATRVDYNLVELGREGDATPSCEQPLYLDLALA